MVSDPEPAVQLAPASDPTADVAVIGAGIAGLRTALLLASAGLRVAVCKAGVVAGAVSGRNMAR